MSYNFDASSSFAGMLYAYLVGIAYCFWQLYTRSHLERTFKPQLASFAQPVSKTMLWFTRFITASFILRAIWLYLKESELLADDDSCSNSWKCPRVVVTVFNRSSSLTNFIAYSLIVLLWIRWSSPPQVAAPGDAKQQSKWDTFFLVLDVWMGLLQVIIFILTMVGGFSEDTVDGKLHDIYTGQVSAFLFILAGTMTYAAVMVVRHVNSQLERYGEWQARTSTPAGGDKLPFKPPADVYSRAPASPSASVLSFGSLGTDADVAPKADWGRQDSCCVRTFACCRRRSRAGDVTQDQSNRTVRTLKRARSIVLMAAVVTVPLMVIKAVMFAYKPLTGDNIEGQAGDVLYPYFFYAVPELAAGLWILAITTPHYHGMPCCGLCQKYEPTRAQGHAADLGDGVLLADDDGIEMERDIEVARDPGVGDTNTAPLLYTDIQALKERSRRGERPEVLRRTLLDASLPVAGDEDVGAAAGFSAVASSVELSRASFCSYSSDKSFRV